MPTRIQLRRGTTAEWDAHDPILAAGEVGVELDAGDGDVLSVRVGDDVHSWSELPNISATLEELDVYSKAEVDALVTGQSINAQTGTTYTLVAGDAGKLVTLSNASPITLTVPQDSDATIPIGTYVDLYQLGAGQVTIEAGTGATLRVSGLTADARAQYSRLAVQKVSADTWSLFGDLAAS